MTAVSDEQRPVLRVVKGDATPEEVAALVAVIAAMGSGRRRGQAEAAAAPGPTPPAGSRTTHPHGPGAWRSSGLPH